jgi:trk system potassium uptake protein TrkH
MRWRYTLHVIGALVFCVGLTMAVPLGFSLYYGDASRMALAQAMLVTMAAGALLYAGFRGHARDRTLNHREGMAIVALAWVAAGLFGGLPFLLGGTFPSAVDCFFESFSGFTTTGASILTDIEGQPKGLLFWRSMTHWLGGMGIIVLSIAILPFLGVGGMQLYKAEVPGPVPDKLKPRIKDTATVLWKVYLLFSALEAVLLLFGGMSLFDSLCHTFGTMATGGFSTKNTSIAAFHSPYIDWVITVFMLIAGINFSLHYLALKGRPLKMLKDPELRFFLGLFAVFGLVIGISIYGQNYDTVGETLRYTCFQTASILTTTGYATADFELWTPIAVAILVMCMFIGGSAGSTGGGMKVMRIQLLLKHASHELFKIIHPRSVSRVKLGRTNVSTDVLSSIQGFFVLWLGLLVACAFVVAATGVDVVTSFASSLACIGNIGPGIGSVGPAENYAHIPHVAKLALMFCMVLGRLEVYTVIILLAPEFWRK